VNENTPKLRSAACDSALYAVLLALAGITSYCLWALASITLQYLGFRSGNYPPPPLSPVASVVLGHRALLLWLPAPWVLFAVLLVFRGARSAYAQVWFASTLAFALIAAAAVLAVVVTLIFIPFPRAH
jgi:hypothetical protein